MIATQNTTFSFQIDNEGEITFSNEAWKYMKPDDQNDILMECQDVIETSIPKRIHKALGGKLYALVVSPVMSKKNEQDRIVVNGFQIPFTLFDDVVVNNIVDIVFFIALREGELYLDGINVLVESHTGMKRKDILGKRIADIVPKDSVSRVLKRNWEAIETGKTVHWLESRTYPLGLRYFEVSVTPIYNDRSECQALIGTAHDITDIKIAEMETYKNFSIINSIIEGTSDSIFVKDLDGRYQLINESAAKILGLSSYDLLQKRDYELFSDETASQFVTSDREVLEDGIQRTYEEDVVINNQHYHFLSVKGVYRNQDGKVAGTFGISRDISKFKKIEKDLTHSNSLLRATLNATADGILVLDKDRKVAMFNDKFLELWKFSKNFVESTSYEEMLTRVMNQLKNPEECWDRLEEIELNPVMSSYDIIEFKDGRVFERYTIPQIVNKEIAGRVFSYRSIGAGGNVQESQPLEKPLQ